MCLCLCCHIPSARLNTSHVEWMSVSVSRLEAGGPSCDSMWLPGASRSWLLTAGGATRPPRPGGTHGDHSSGFMVTGSGTNLSDFGLLF